MITIGGYFLLRVSRSCQDGDGKISVYDYVSTQMRTFGDFQGDGECPTRTSR